MMTRRFEAKAVPGAKEFRFGPERRYVIAYDINGKSEVKPPFIERVYFEYRDLENEDRYGRPKQRVVTSTEFDFDSTMQQLQSWIVKQVLDFEAST
jgi:hypothetical protein